MSNFFNRPLPRTTRRQRPVFVGDVHLPVICRSSSRASTRTSSQRTRRGPSIHIHQRASAPKWGGVFVHACPQPPPSSSSQWAKTRTGLSSPCGRGPGGGAPVSQSRTRAATASADRAVYLPSGQCQQPLILARYSPASSFCPVNWAKSYRKIASVLPCFLSKMEADLSLGSDMATPRGPSGGIGTPVFFLLAARAEPVPGRWDHERSSAPAAGDDIEGGQHMSSSWPGTRPPAGRLGEDGWLGITHQQPGRPPNGGSLCGACSRSSHLP